MAIFDEKIEIRKRCKGVHCVDLGESFPTSIYLQNLASIQPRTSPTKTIPDTPIPTPPPPLKPTLKVLIHCKGQCSAVSRPVAGEELPFCGHRSDCGNRETESSFLFFTLFVIFCFEW